MSERNNSTNQLNRLGTIPTDPTTSSPNRKSLDRSRSRLDFSPLHMDYKEPMPSLATSVLSTKNLVENCEDIETRGVSMRDASPGRTYECEDVCRKGSKTCFSIVGITVITVGYLICGAIIFSVIETNGSALDAQQKVTEIDSPTVMNSNELIATLSEEVNSYLDEIRAHTVKRLWEMTEKMNILYPKNWTHNAAVEILSFQDLLSRKLAAEILSQPRTQGIETDKSPNAKPSASGPSPHPPKEDWNLSRGLLYSLTLLTTIGRLV